VLTGSGGAPGPIWELNAEIYYPPYLYLTDGSGKPAPRPSILASTEVAELGTQIQATVGPADTISKVNMLRMGSVTHSINFDQRFMPMAFTQSGQTISFTLPTDPTVMIPGNYMIFVFNAAGVPSVAATVLVPSPS